MKTRKNYYERNVKNAITKLTPQQLKQIKGGEGGAPIAKENDFD